jgi:ribosomal protein L40E
MCYLPLPEKQEKTSGIKRSNPMPYCPSCQSEYRIGFTRCSSCDVDLVDQLEREVHFSEEEVQNALSGQELVPISRGSMDAVLETREVMSAQRIPALVVEDKEQPSDPNHPKRMVLVVRKTDLPRANEVLGDMFKKLVNKEGLNANVELKTDICPACQNKVPEDATECPECGLFIGKGS